MASIIFRRFCDIVRDFENEVGGSLNFADVKVIVLGTSYNKIEPASMVMLLSDAISSVPIIRRNIGVDNMFNGEKISLKRAENLVMQVCHVYLLHLWFNQYKKIHKSRRKSYLHSFIGL